MKNIIFILALTSFGLMDTALSQRAKSEIQVTAKFQIHEGKLHAFKQLAAQCLKSVKEKDTGTLQYDWYYNNTGTMCIVRETYKNSEAILEHSGNLGDLLDSLLAISDFSAEIYGSPSDELLGALAGLDLTVFDFSQGM
jgi:quinol monooxygenase YgiN